MERDGRFGPRLPAGPPRRTVRECFRCADDRRVLRDFGIYVGKLIGTIALCEPCAQAVTPLNPDPLEVQRIA